ERLGHLLRADVCRDVRDSARRPEKSPTAASVAPRRCARRTAHDAALRRARHRPHHRGREPSVIRAEDLRLDRGRESPRRGAVRPRAPRLSSPRGPRESAADDSMAPMQGSWRSAAVLAAVVAVSAAAPPDGPPGFSFTNIAREAGLDAKIVFGGATANKYLIETTGTGVALIDHDGHRARDPLFVNG